MNAIIIDDEKKARTLLRTMLEEYCPKVTAIAEAEDLISGVALIKKNQPQIVFLDIEMPEYSGLEILDFLDTEQLTFEIIFTTAYSEYAVQAFKLSAIDYLLKPLRPKLIQQAVDKAEKNISHHHLHKRLEELSHSIKNQEFTKIALPVADGILFTGLLDIICFKADGMYTIVHTVSGKEIMISKPLKYFGEIIGDNSNFYRAHRSYMINIHKIQQYIKKQGGYIIMDNQMTIPISKEKRDGLFALMEL